MEKKEDIEIRIDKVLPKIGEPFYGYHFLDLYKLVSEIEHEVYEKGKLDGITLSTKNFLKSNGAL